MKYIVLPIDGTQVIMHEETLIEKRNALGLTTLPSEDTGQIEWTYPNYDYGTNELNELLSNSEWASNEESIN